MNLREWALPVYTILTQLAIGALTVLWILRWMTSRKNNVDEIDRVFLNPILVIVFTSAVALVAAHFHLSKPFHSYLAVLNFKTSWLSREILFSILFFWALLGLLYLTFFKSNRRSLITAVGWFAIILGIVLIYCMAHIYILPTQAAWNSTLVIFSFYLTGMLLGVNSLACLMILDLRFAEIQGAAEVELRARLIKSSLVGLTFLTILLVLASFVLLNIQIYQLSRGDLIARTSLRLLVELYLPLLMVRHVFQIMACLLLGIVLYRLYKLDVAPQNLISPVYLACLLILVGEIIGRFLFYATHIRVGL